MSQNGASAGGRYSPAALSARLDGLDREVEDVKDGVGKLSTKIDNLSAIISAGRVTNWQPILTFASVAVAIITVIGALALNPLRGDLMTIEARQAQAPETYVPRREMEQRWARQDIEFSNLREMQQDIAKRFGETYTVRDALDDMQERMTRLQDEINAARESDGSF